MRIKKLHIYGFGQHTNRVIELDRGMTLLYGLNEAGKTTIYEFILQILFGFPQKNHVLKSYEPKNGGAFGGQLEIEDSEYGSYTIERVSGKAGGIVKVYMANGQRGDESLLNDLLRGYSRNDVESVFAFSMHQLQNLEKMTEDDLNRTLLASGTTGVEQLTTIEKQVSKEAAALFKKSGQNPLINKLIKELQQQDNSLKETRQRLAEYEPKRVEIAEIEQKINAIELEQATLSEAIKEAQIYLQNEPLLKKQCTLIEALSKVEAIDFPPHSIQRFEQNDVRLQQVQQEVIHLQRRLVDLEKEVQAVVNEEQLKQMKIWYRSDEQWREWRMQRDRLLAQQHSLELQLEMKKQLLGIEKRVMRVDSSLANEAVFKKQLNEIKELKEQSDYEERMLAEEKSTLKSMKESMAYSRKTKNNNRQIKNMPTLVAIIIAAASILMGIIFQQWGTALFGIVVAGVLFVLMRKESTGNNDLSAESESQRLRKRIADIEKSYEQLQSERQRKNEALQSYFNDLGITGQIEEEIYEELFQNIRTLQQQLVEQRQIDDELDYIQQQIAAHYEIGCQFLNAEVNESDLSAFVRELIQEEELALKKLAFTLEKRHALQLQLQSFQEQEEVISLEQQQLIHTVGASDVEGFYRMAEQAEQRVQLEQQLQQLEQQIGTNKNSVVYSVSQLDEMQARYEVNKQQYTALLKEHSLLTVEVQHLVKDNQYSIQLQEQEQLKGELNAFIKKWVQLKMIEEAIAESLGNLKEQKLPKVLVDAANFFSDLTNEHYVDLLFEGDKFIAITNENSRFSIDELSQATKEQAYLALRLALANEKCKTAPFPFILDDPFVHFDTLRTAKVVQLLGNIQQEHQILFFSCQERMRKDFTEKNIIEVRALQTKGD